jgi:superfamily II DNA/RNA helicase
MDQPARMAALERFRRNEVTLLVASDVAARGLDIPDVSHVYNFDVPHHADDYVHRIGRTGRAGRSGVAITLTAPADTKSVAAIEKLIGQSIPWMATPAVTVVDEKPAAERPRHRSARGHDRRPAPQAKRPAASAPPQAAKPKAAARAETPRAAARAETPRTRDSEGFALPAFLLRPVPVKA